MQPAPRELSCDCKYHDPPLMECMRKSKNSSSKEGGHLGTTVNNEHGNCPTILKKACTVLLLFLSLSIREEGEAVGCWNSGLAKSPPSTSSPSTPRGEEGGETVLLMFELGYALNSPPPSPPSCSSAATMMEDCATRKEQRHMTL